MAISHNLIERIEELERRVRTLERSHPGAAGNEAGNLAHFDGNGILDASRVGIEVPMSTADVGNPPTAAQCVTAFGAASLGDGVRGVIDDADGGATLWLICVVNGVWGAEQLTVLS